jgi:hypothetical protein
MAAQMPRPPGPLRRAIATVEFDGLQADVEVVGDRWVVRGALGAPQELSREEADALCAHSGDLARYAEDRGVRGEDRGGPPSRLAATRGRLPAEGLTVLLDTSTVFNANEALRTDQPPSHIALLDLSVFTVAAACFDTPLVLQPDAPYDPFEGVRCVENVPPSTPDDRTALDDIYAEAFEQMREPQVRRDYQRRWATFLGRSDVTVGFDKIATLDEEMSYGYRSTMDIGRLLATASESPETEDDLANVLGIHTVRTGYNDLVAAALGVPYLASSFRLPVSSKLAHRKTQMLRVLQGLISAAAPAPESKPAAVLDPDPPIAAPLLLALVLEQMSEPADYWAALAQLRDRFAPLRARLAADREEAGWDERPSPYLRAFLKRMEKDQRVNVFQEALLAATKGIPVVGVGAALLAASLKVMGAVNPAERARRLWLRQRRPEVYLLIDVAKDAASLRLLDGRIEEIWRQPPRRGNQQELERLSGLHSDPFLKPIRLDT